METKRPAEAGLKVESKRRLLAVWRRCRFYRRVRQAGEIREHRRNLEGHLLARGEQRDGLVLRDLQLVVVRVHFDATPQGQGSDLRDVTHLQRWSVCH